MDTELTWQGVLLLVAIGGYVKRDMLIKLYKDKFGK